MSRSTQWIGLSKTAMKFIDENCIKVPVVTCSTCKHITGGHFLTETDRHAVGMFDEPIPLTTYAMYSSSKHGEVVKKVKEVVQCEPWSSGPMIFTHLQLEDDSFVGSWTDEEIDQMVNG